MIALDGRLHPEAFYWANQVAEIVFARRVEWFYAHRAQLEAEGFPPPMSHVGRPRWVGRALIAWCNRPPSQAAAPAGPPPSNVLGLRARAMFADPAFAGRRRRPE